MEVLLFIILVLAVILLILWKKNITYAEIIRQLNTRLEEQEISHKKGLEIQKVSIKGQALENIAPFLPNFPHIPSNCRFLGKPVDYVIFENLEDKEKPISLVFMDVKTGKTARLTKDEKRIKEACEAGRTSFEIYHIKETEEGIEPELK